MIAPGSVAAVDTEAAEPKRRQSQWILSAFHGLIGFLTIYAVLMVGLLSNRVLGSYGWAAIVVLGLGSLLVIIPRSGTRRIGELLWRGLLVAVLLWSQFLLAERETEAAGRVLAVALAIAVAVFFAHVLQQFDLAAEQRAERSCRRSELLQIHEKLDLLLQRDSAARLPSSQRSSVSRTDLAFAGVVVGALMLGRWRGKHHPGPNDRTTVPPPT